MADEEKIIKFLDAVADAASGLRKELGNTDKAFSSFSEKTKNAKNTLEALAVKYGSLQAALKANKKEVEDQIKLCNDAAKAQKAYDEEIKKIIGDTEASTSVFKKMTGIVSGAIGKFSGLATMVGVSTFAFRDITKIGIEYNTSMVNILKTQNSMGKGLQNADDAITELSKSTNLSKVQFAQFAEVINSGMAGIKMSLSEVAALSETLNKIGIIGSDAQKKKAQELMSIQSKFPSLYNDIMKAQKLAADTAGGEGTQAQKEQLALLRDHIMATQMLTGVSVEGQNSIRASLADVSKEQQELNKAKEEQAKVDKAMQDAQIALWNKLQPMVIAVLKTIAAIVNYAKSWVGLTHISIIGVIALVANYGKIFNTFRKTFQMYKEFQILQKTMNTLAAIKFLIDEADAVAMGNFVAAAAAATIAIGAGIYAATQHNDKIKQGNDELDEQGNKLTNAQVKQQEINAEMEAMLGIIDKASGSYKTLIDISSRFGTVNEEALKGMIVMTKEAANEAKKGLAGQLNTLKGKFNINVNWDMGDSDKLASAVVEQLDIQERKLRGIIGSEDDHKAIMEEKTKILEAQKLLRERTAAIVDAEYDKDLARVNQMEASTSKKEAALQTEAKLLSMMGMGLGVNMKMQARLADLAYRQKETYDNTNKIIDARIKKQYALTDEQVEQVHNSETAEDAEKMIASWGKRKADAQYSLNKDYALYQDLSKKSMEQQEKIYEITKNIREGYLDAIKEMSIGAGEFEKIIGTQNMGVTQIMNTVHKMSGEWKLNTLKVGGVSPVQQGIGTDTTMRITAGGIEGVGPQANANMMKRLYNPKTNGINVGAGVVAGRNDLGESQIASVQEQQLKSQTDQLSDAIYGGSDAVVNAINGKGNIPSERARIGVDYGLGTQGQTPQMPAASFVSASVNTLRNQANPPPLNSGLQIQQSASSQAAQNATAQSQNEGGETQESGVGEYSSQYNTVQKYENNVSDIQKELDKLQDQLRVAPKRAQLVEANLEITGGDSKEDIQSKIDNKKTELAKSMVNAWKEKDKLRELGEKASNVGKSLYGTGLSTPEQIVGLGGNTGINMKTAESSEKLSHAIQHRDNISSELEDLSRPVLGENKAAKKKLITKLKIEQEANNKIILGLNDELLAQNNSSKAQASTASSQKNVAATADELDKSSKASLQAEMGADYQRLQIAQQQLDDAKAHREAELAFHKAEKQRSKEEKEAARREADEKKAKRLEDRRHNAEMRKQKSEEAAAKRKEAKDAKIAAAAQAKIAKDAKTSSDTQEKVAKETKKSHDDTLKLKGGKHGKTMEVEDLIKDFHDKKLKFAGGKGKFAGMNALNAGVLKHVDWDKPKVSEVLASKAQITQHNVNPAVEKNVKEQASRIQDIAMGTGKGSSGEVKVTISLTDGLTAKIEKSDGVATTVAQAAASAKGANNG